MYREGGLREKMEIDMNIKKAEINDLDEIMILYAHARDYMAAHGNKEQWGENYPSGAYKDGYP